MKRFFGFALILGLLSIPAFAAKNSQSLNLASAVKVGATSLPAGDYKVSWTGTGSSVQVTIAHKGVATVTVPAKIVEAKNGHVGITTGASNGAQILETIQLNNFNLVLTSASGQGE